MNKSRYFELPKGTTHLHEINTSQVCTNAKYTFDFKLLCEPNDLFELVNGQWFLLRHDLRILIEGKWEPTPIG